MTEESFLPTFSANVKTATKSGSSRINPTNHFSLSGGSAVTLTEFNAFVRQNRIEKIYQALRKEKKYEDPPSHLTRLRRTIWKPFTKKFHDAELRPIQRHP